MKTLSIVMAFILIALSVSFAEDLPVQVERHDVTVRFKKRYGKSGYLVFTYESAVEENILAIVLIPGPPDQVKLVLTETGERRMEEAAQGKEDLGVELMLGKKSIAYKLFQTATLEKALILVSQASREEIDTAISRLKTNRPNE